MSKKSSLIIFIIVVVILVLGITLWANNSTKNAGTQSPTPSPSIDPSVQGTTTATSTSSGSGSSYTLAQVAQHKTQADCWTAVNGKVYNLSPFITLHPGGAANIMKICGIDGTATFTAQHGGQPNPTATIANFQIGILAQ